MDRRSFIAGAAAAATLAPVKSRASVQRDAAVNVVERFGFIGDGRADNYEAFHRLAAHANSQGGGRFHFPPGAYAVRRHRTVSFGSTQPGIVRNATYLDLDGLELAGRGARILLDGRFHRSGRIGRDGLTLGVHHVHFMPFDVRRSRNIRIEGLEIDGGARDTRRDPNVVEGYAHLVALNACSNVELVDLHLHHALADGIYLGDDFAHSGVLPGRVCRNVRLTRVSCRHNARGGLAALHVLGLTAGECDFSSNGHPGLHGGHAPGMGVNFEPDRNRVGPEIDSHTGDCEFLRCTFHDNHSAILAAYIASYTGYCRFIDCDSRNANGGEVHIIAGWPGEGMLIQGGDHDAGTGAVYASFQQPGGVTRLKGLTLRSRHMFGLLHGFGGSLAEVEDCTIIGTHREPGDGSFIFFGQDPGGGRRNLFRNNRIFVPAARKRRGAAFQMECTFANTDLIGNEYRTDLSRAGEYFVRNADLSSCRISGERFRGAFPGRGDTFRPLASDVHDTRLPFSAP